MIENIVCDGVVMAVILRAEYHSSGVEFFTPDNFSQQLGYMNRPKGYVIAPHIHNPIPRVVEYTKEVIIIKSGKLRIDFYDGEKNYLQSRMLNQGDLALLASGAHGFEVIETCEILEVKQGPYVGEQDKTRFDPISADRIKITG